MTQTFKSLFIILFISISMHCVAAENTADTVTETLVKVTRFDSSDPWLPEDVLLVRAGLPGVFVVYQQQARFRMVRVGKQHKQKTLFLSGLQNDDLVIRKPGKLYDGQAVKVQP